MSTTKEKRRDEVNQQNAIGKLDSSIRFAALDADVSALISKYNFPNPKKGKNTKKAFEKKVANEEKWTASEREDLMNEKRLELLVEQAEALKTDFDTAELTKTVETGLGRNSSVGGAPIALISDVFNLEAIGQIATHSTGQSVILYQLDAINAADMTSDESSALLQAINQQIEASLDQEIFESFANAVRLRTEIELDQQAINAVHANFQ